MVKSVKDVRYCGIHRLTFEVVFYRDEKADDWKPARGCPACDLEKKYKNHLKRQRVKR